MSRTRRSHCACFRCMIRTIRGFYSMLIIFFKERSELTRHDRVDEAKLALAWRTAQLDRLFDTIWLLNTDSNYCLTKPNTSSVNCERDRSYFFIVFRKEKNERKTVQTKKSICLWCKTVQMHNDNTDIISRSKTTRKQINYEKRNILESDLPVSVITQRKCRTHWTSFLSFYFKKCFVNFFSIDQQ